MNLGQACIDDGDPDVFACRDPPADAASTAEAAVAIRYGGGRKNALSTAIVISM